MSAFDELRLPTDRTLAVTWGRWGGFYRLGRRGLWRVCIGWIAVTYIRDEFAAVLRAYADRLDSDEALGKSTGESAAGGAADA